MQFLTPSLQSRIFASTDAHIYIKPHPLLQPYIAHYTLNLQEIANKNKQLVLIPDIAGCMVITPSPHELDIKYWGATTKTVIVNNNHPPERFFIEFKPGGSFPFTGIPQKELLNQQVAMQQILPEWKHKIQEFWFSSACINDFLGLLENFLLSKLHHNGSPNFLNQLSICLREHKGLDEICAFSDRHLHRILQNQVGTGIKVYQRLIRINQALEFMCDFSLTLTQIAYLSGYYDQSHFIHDFKQVCGVTPGVYRKQMSDFYNESFKF